MDQGKASQTALRVAMARAAHQLFDEPRLLEDPIAVDIIGKENLAEIARTREEYGTPYALRLRAFLAARMKYAEDSLASAVRKGARQFVILGAGLDTFPYRDPNPPGTLKIFEVDHPSTQTFKRELLAAAGIATSGHLCFVPGTLSGIPSPASS